MTINQLPDLEDVYSRMTVNVATPVIVHNPNICDGNGVLIPTTEYNNKLKNGTILQPFAVPKAR